VKRRTPNDIYVAGIGMTPVGEHWEKSLRVLALEAISAARAEAPSLAPQALYVGNMLSGPLSGQLQLGALIADFVGLRGIEAVTVEAAGASGGLALRQAYLAIASGLQQVVLVLGVEKVTDRIGPKVEAALAGGTDTDFEASQGTTLAGQAALLMRRYLHESQAPADALAGFSIVAHANAVHNPCAYYRRALRPEVYTQAAKLSEPLSVYDAAPYADGAAALILARGHRLQGDTHYPSVRIAASAVATSTVALHDRKDPLWLSAASQSASDAYAQSGLTPEDIDLFELHDAFSIYAALTLEAAGFAPRGQGWRLARDGVISLQGRLPICTFGGSKARGDAGGATGVYQLAEVTMQLQGRGGANQVPEAKIGMAQCLGGAGSTAATHILVKEDG